MERTVMVIDDDKIFNLMAKVLLRDTGISADPVICTSSWEALTLLRQQLAPDKVFLLFLDINMPLMTGWEMLDVLQGFPFHKNISVFIVTSSIDKADEKKARTYPQIIGYLIKPIKKEILLALKSSPSLVSFFSS